MEYNQSWPYLLGALWLLLWGLDFWRVGSQSHLAVPANFKVLQGGRALTRLLSFLCGALGILFISYGALEPRKAIDVREGYREALDIFLVVDVSRSMLAEDMEPNRLELTKDKLREFALMKPKDRISIILFSEGVFTLLPPTTDPYLVLQMIDKIDVGYLGSGTNIGDALGLAVARSQISDADNKVIILLTDGVSNVGNLTPLQAAEQAVKYNLRVYTIGVGTEDDAKLPVGSGVFGKRYVTIPGGGIDFETLQKISDMTGGKMYKVESAQAFQQTLEDIDQLERSEVKGESQIVFDERYYRYIVIGIILFLISECLRRLMIRELV